MFIKYKNINNDSNVNCYEIGQTYIDVVFCGTNKVYRYSYNKAGVQHVENMKLLAEKGDGLNSYINKFCKYLYD